MNLSPGKRKQRRKGFRWIKVTHSQRMGRSMEGWIEKAEDRESADYSEKDLKLTALELFEKKTDFLYSPSFDCMSEIREVS